MLALYWQIKYNGRLEKQMKNRSSSVCQKYHRREAIWISYVNPINHYSHEHAGIHKMVISRYILTSKLTLKLNHLRHCATVNIPKHVQSLLKIVQHVPKPQKTWKVSQASDYFDASAKPFRFYGNVWRNCVTLNKISPKHSNWIVPTLERKSLFFIHFSEHNMSVLLLIIMTQHP